MLLSAKQKRAATAAAEKKAEQVRLCVANMSVFKRAERRS